MNRTPWPLFLAVLACGGGGGGDAIGCRSNTECGPGLVCVVPVSGQGGACQAPPLAIAMKAPPAGARVGQGGATVVAEVTLGAADAAAPPVVLVVNGSETITLSPTGRSGGVVTYGGSYLPPAGAVLAPALFVAAKTSAGLVPSDGVFVDVDTKPPALRLTSGPGCGTHAECPRDGDLDVFIAMTEDHPDVIEATIDLDGHALAVPFGPAQFGSDLVASIPLARYPFPRFSGAVTPRVHARDAFGNEATLELPAFPVTRLRWAYDAGAPVTGAAISAAGEAVVGVSATVGNLRGIRSDGVESWKSTMTTGGKTTGSFITAAPSIGASTIWVGSDDGRLYGRADASGIFGCPAGAAATGPMFTPALRLTASEAAYGSAAQGLYGATPANTCLMGASTTDTVSSGAVFAGGWLYLATTKTARVTLRRFTDAPADDGSLLTACSSITSPLAVMSSGDVLFSCANGDILQVNSALISAVKIASLEDFSAGSPLAFENGDLLVGTEAGKLHRLSPPLLGTGDWNEAWLTPLDLGAAVRGAIIARDDQNELSIAAVTIDGQLYWIDENGSGAWNTRSETTPPLGTARLSFPTIAPADPARPNSLPTLYAGSEDGHLYAVVVDAGLDPRSPWPKAHHDLRNTGNAAAPVTP